MPQDETDWKTRAAADTIAVVIDLMPRFYRSVAGELARQEGDQLVLPARTHYRLLGLLVQSPGSSLTDLASRVGMTKTNASPLVEKLVHEGLVYRKVHPEDRRVQALYLTDRGFESFHRGVFQLTDGLSKRFGVLDDSEGIRLKNALATLVEILPKLL